MSPARRIHHQPLGQRQALGSFGRYAGPTTLILSGLAGGPSTATPVDRHLEYCMIDEGSGPRALVPRRGRRCR